MTEKELLFAAKTAWRNTPRCIGRFQWNSLEVRILTSFFYRGPKEEEDQNCTVNQKDLF